MHLCSCHFHWNNPKDNQSDTYQNIRVNFNQEVNFILQLFKLPHSPLKWDKKFRQWTLRETSLSWLTWKVPLSWPTSIQSQINMIYQLRAKHG